MILLIKCILIVQTVPVIVHPVLLSLSRGKRLSDTKFRKTLHRGWTALRIIKVKKRRCSGVKLWPGATCGSEICRIYTRILVAKSAGVIPGFW